MIVGNRKKKRIVIMKTTDNVTFLGNFLSGREYNYIDTRISVGTVIYTKD